MDIVALVIKCHHCGFEPGNGGAIHIGWAGMYCGMCVPSDTPTRELKVRR